MKLSFSQSGSSTPTQSSSDKHPLSSGQENIVRIIRTQSSSDNDTSSSLSSSGERSISSFLSFPCLTQESRNEESDFMSNDINSNWMLGSSPSMTKGNDVLSITKGNNAPSMAKENNAFLTSDSDTTPLSSSCLTRRSRKHECQIETGRSMVEMLGVLAVIGVLSIGGIMGYSYGMDKYKANRAINEINLRLVDLIQQQQMGRALDFSSWKDEATIYPIDVYHNDLLGGTAIVIDEVPSKICKIIGDSFKEKAVIFIGSEIFDEDSNETDDPCNASDKNTIELYFSGIQCDPACGENEYCDNGWCLKTSGRPRIVNSACGAEGAACTTENGQDGFCETDICVPLGTCTSNEECGPKEYCGVVNYVSATERFPSGVTGTCVKTNFLRYEIDDTIYYVSATSLNWWNAKWACAKIGKKHLELSDLLNVTGKNLATATDLSIKFSKIIGNQYIWVVPEKDQYHMWTPLLAKDYLDPTHVFNYDMKKNNHARVAICK